MCCEDFEPAPVAVLLEHYRALAAQRGLDWGDDRPELIKALGSFAYRYEDEHGLGQLHTRPKLELGDEGALLASIEDTITKGDIPPGVAIVSADVIRLPDPLPFAIDDHDVHYDVFLNENGRRSVRAVTVNTSDPWLSVDGRSVRAVEAIRSGRLRLTSDAVSRWIVVDERGGGWFPEGALRKYDYYGRPFFHGNDLHVDVPVGRVTVTVARGGEFRSASTTVDVSAERETHVELRPARVYDAAAQGWHGGDLHVHMNFSGDQVCRLQDAALMQEGEGLHLMNIGVANENTSLVYDREIFEHFAGVDLPWTKDNQVARMGVEYRNNLFGHFIALGPVAPPSRYQTGHPRSDEPQDWPPNAIAAEEFRQLNSTISYTHPFQKSGVDPTSIADIFAEDRSYYCEGKELIADAALGLVDSVDLAGISFQDLRRTEHVYHRLLGCGIRLAATAGSDVMMSRSRNGSQSNPPGWCRAYANLKGRPLSVESWQEAVRAGRTFATNGPWLELETEGSGPGDTVTADEDRLSVTARVIGFGVDTLEIVGPDGVLAQAALASDSEDGQVRADIQVDEPTWIAAVARGRGHLSTLGPEVYAHTSPIWVEVGGRTVGRPSDAKWCLEWLEHFEALATKKGRFFEPGQLDDLLAVLDKARIFYRNILETDRLASSTRRRTS